MKTQRLAFSQLHEELEVLERRYLRGITGGVDEEAIYEFGMNGYGQKFIRLYGTTEWTPMLDTVEIPFISNESMRPNFDYNNFQFVWDNYNPFGFGGGNGGNSSGPPTQVFDLGMINLDNHINFIISLAHINNNTSVGIALERLSIAVSAGNLILDARALVDYYDNSQGNMDGIRFAIRQGGAAVVFLEASASGGIAGLTVGMAGAGLIWASEFTYDAFKEWMALVVKGLSDYEKALANGWKPTP